MTNIPNQAEEKVNRFVRRFEESYRLLAYHAALPLVLTPELVNYFRNEFLRGEGVPWVAEIDLLLSDLCSQVGYELYAMDTSVRAYLLAEMKRHYGKQRMQEVAQVLIDYVKYLRKLYPGRREELEAQRWAAMVYLGDEECQETAREISQRLLAVGSGMDTEISTDTGIRAELARLTRITSELSPQLEREPELLDYARLVQQVLRQPGSVSPAELIRSYRVDDVELIFPKRLLPQDLVAKLESDWIPGFPELRICEFEVGTISVEDEDLLTFEFEVGKIEVKQTGWLGRETEVVVKRYRQQAEYFIEDLENGVQLEMVAIPGGKFIMGAPKDELESGDDERPQHQVTVPGFFMGKYPVTQAQWRVVSVFPQVNRKLKLEPSRFKGDNRPVERVSWYDAVEFCDRLSRYTKREYRLPSEAEWEYGCRGGTKTPFHFGETITTEVANYDGNYIYGKGVKGEYREETTEVGKFGVGNEYGLYDMHGNIWEWCLDDWHDNYEGAPEDGRAWFNNENENLSQKEGDAVLRGGSWFDVPRICRSASRYLDGWDRRDYFSIIVGFRVVCGGVGRTL